jgi:hypothetical protein
MDAPIYEPLMPASCAVKKLSDDSTDAIALLMADHRRVERRFLEFQMTTSMRREEELAMEICDAKLHLLHELFEQHVRMEEKTHGIFARAQESPMDLEAVGAAMELRQAETTAVY